MKQSQSVPKELEDAAKEFASRFEPDNGWGAQISFEAFIAGAKWAERVRWEKAFTVSCGHLNNKE